MALVQFKKWRCPLLPGFRRVINRPIRDFPDNATFREKGAKLACADKLGVFLSVTLCNKAIFDPLQ